MPLAIQGRLLANLCIDVKESEACLPDAFRMKGTLASLVGTNVNWSGHLLRNIFAQGTVESRVLVVQVSEIDDQILRY